MPKFSWGSSGIIRANNIINGSGVWDFTINDQFLRVGSTFCLIFLDCFSSLYWACYLLTEEVLTIIFSSKQNQLYLGLIYYRAMEMNALPPWNFLGFRSRLMIGKEFIWQDLKYFKQIGSFIWMQRGSWEVTRSFCSS